MDFPFIMFLQFGWKSLSSSNASSCRCTDGGVYLISIVIEMLSLRSLVLLGL